MPGAPYLYTPQDSTPPEMGRGAPSAKVATGGSSTAFIIWLVVIGVVLPVLVLGGLRVGGFQFVYKSR